jgi:hypothetical protein
MNKKMMETKRSILSGAELG